MDKTCPRCGKVATCERSERPNNGPIQGAPAVVDLYLRCVHCRLRIDASGIGDRDAEVDLAHKLRNYDRTRKIQVPARRGGRRRR